MTITFGCCLGKRLLISPNSTIVSGPITATPFVIFFLIFRIGASSCKSGSKTTSFSRGFPRDPIGPLNSGFGPTFSKGWGGTKFCSLFSKATPSIFGAGISSTIFNFFLPIFFAFVGLNISSSCCTFNTGFIVTFVIPLFSNLANKSFLGKAISVSSTISGFPITTATGFLSPTTGLYFNFSFNASKGFIAYIETRYKFFTK